MTRRALLQAQVKPLVSPVLYGAVATPNLGISVAGTGHLFTGVTGLLSASVLGTVSVGFWMRFDGAPLLTYGNAFEIWQSNQLYTARTYEQLFTGTSGAEGTANRRLISIDPGGGASHSVTPPSQDVWHYVSLVRWFNGSVWVWEEYIDGVLDHTFTAPDSGWTITGPDQINLGFDGAGNGGTDSSNHSYRCLRIWKSQLTAANLLAEMASKTPVITSNLWCNFPLNGLTDLTDTVSSFVMSTGGSTVSQASSGPPALA